MENYGDPPTAVAYCLENVKIGLGRHRFASDRGAHHQREPWYFSVRDD